MMENPSFGYVETWGGVPLNDKFAVIHVETFPVKSPSDGCFSQHAHGFVSMNWNLIL